MKELADLAASQMHGRSNNVSRLFPAQLYDVFSQVRFHDTQAFCFQGLVEMDLLAHHALGLGNQPGGRLPGNLEDDPDRFRCILRTMDNGAVPLVDRDELL